MKLVLLGSGSAVPDPERGNPSQAVVTDGEAVLVDCGERTSVNLVRAGINPVDVEHLFFTHLHWDHIGDFGYFFVSTWACGRRRPLRVHGPPGTAAMVEASVHGVHAADAAFLRRYAEALPPQIAERPEPTPPVAVRELDVGDTVDLPECRVLAGPVEHHQRLGMPSLAYRFESRHGSIAISGDTGPSDSFADFARGVDVLVHDAAFLEETIETRGMWSHSSPSTAARTAAAAGVSKLVLTHLGPYTSADAVVAMGSMYYGERRDPGIWDEIVARARKEFGGEIVLGRDTTVVAVGGC